VLGDRTVLVGLEIELFAFKKIEVAKPKLLEPVVAFRKIADKTVGTATLEVFEKIEVAAVGNAMLEAFKKTEGLAPVAETTTEVLELVVAALTERADDNSVGTATLEASKKTEDSASVGSDSLD
jgi:hypothetical protein